MSDQLESLFKKLDNQFDVETLPKGHFERFNAKLKRPKNVKKQFNILSFVAIAASIVLFFGIWVGNSLPVKGMELSAISTEMETTQNYFLASIEKELTSIKSLQNKDTQQLINDTFKQLHKLETDYQTLTVALEKSTESNEIIYAMISNFQQRIEILQNVLTQIEIIKQLKTQNHENTI